jgi:hypothetical protein
MTSILSILLVAAAVAPAAAQPGPGYGGPGYGQGPGPGPHQPRNVVGIWQWRSNQGRFFGKLILVQDGGTVKGAITESNAGTTGDLDGTIDGKRMSFRRTWRWGNRVRTQDFNISVDWGGTRLDGSFIDPQDPNAGGDFNATRVFPAAGPGQGPGPGPGPGGPGGPPGGPGGPVVVPPPPPPVVEAPPPRPNVYPMDERTFAQLLQTISAQSFNDNKLSIVTQAAGYNWFVVDQVARVLPLFPFEESKLTVLETLRPRILDPQNGFKLLNLFTYSSSKERAQQILMRR